MMFYRNLVPHILSLRIASELDARNLQEPAASYFAAIQLIKHFLSPKVAKGLWVREEEDIEMANFRAQQAVAIAGYIFHAQRHDDGDEILRRLMRKDAAAMLEEIHAADYFERLDWVVRLRREVGIRGQDFDFTILKGAARVNVDVARLTATAFSRSGLVNMLSKKRSQFPSDQAAIIFCVLPSEWKLNMSEWFSELHEIVFDYFRRTKRISTVMFKIEGADEAGHRSVNGDVSLIFPISNDTARNPVSSEEISASRFSMSQGATYNLCAPRRRRSDFLKWYTYMRQLTLQPWNAASCPLWTEIHSEWP
jgi:hypothetical protein